VRGQPIKVLLFTVAKPLLFLMSRKEIKDPKQLRGKKIAGSSPGGSATMALERGYNELAFAGDIVEFPQNGFGTSEKKIRENPDDVYRMVRATLRGLQFIWDKNNQEAVTNRAYEAVESQ